MEALLHKEFSHGGKALGAGLLTPPCVSALGAGLLTPPCVSALGAGLLTPPCVTPWTHTAPGVFFPFLPPFPIRAAGTADDILCVPSSRWCVAP